MRGVTLFFSALMAPAGSADNVVCLLFDSNQVFVLLPEEGR